MRWIVFTGLLVLLAALLVFVPTPYSTGLFALVILLSLGIGALIQQAHTSDPRQLWAFLRTRSAASLKAVRSRVSEGRDRARRSKTARTVPQSRLRSLPSAAPQALPADDSVGPHIHPLLLHIEIAIIVAVALLASKEYLNLNPELKLPGYEAEWLTSSAHFAANSLKEYGYIPLWQPWLEHGEPLIDNPFSFVLNPISGGPSLLLGGVNGIKISVVLTAIVAGSGGWFLGRMLGLGVVGRVMLGVLLIGKGNMQAMIGAGYFQLGVTQAYFAWIIGGFVAVIRLPRHRWPIILTALSFTLMFLAGNIWYTLPMLLCMGLLAALYLVSPRQRTIAWPAVRRLALTGVVTIGLSAIVLLPVWANRDRIGDHPDDRNAGQPADRAAVIHQFYDGSYDVYARGEAPGKAEFFYSYTAPLWYLLVIFVLFPAGWSHGSPWLTRLWAGAAILFVFHLLWGAGNHPLFVWLYEHVPLLAQWRFVGRALAVSSFWLAVIIALRVDMLWGYLTSAARRRGLWLSLRLTTGMLQATLAAALVLISALAMKDVVGQWYVFAGVTSINWSDAACLEWLRAYRPNTELTVYRHGYDSVTAFLDNKIRLYNIEADFVPIPLDSTLGNRDFTRELPEFGIAWTDVQRRVIRDMGYDVVPLSPAPVDEHHCLYQRASAYPYAFFAPLELFSEPRSNGPEPFETTAIYQLRRKPDQLTLWITPPTDEPLVVVAQERAYPGWRVTVNGEAVPLESVGGLVGVVIERTPGREWEVIRFSYRPPLVMAGSVITLLTALASSVYLANGDRHFGPMRERAARLMHRIRDRVS